jgi:hypothetical protein
MLRALYTHKKIQTLLADLAKNPTNKHIVQLKTITKHQKGESTKQIFE